MQPTLSENQPTLRKNTNKNNLENTHRTTLCGKHRTRKNTNPHWVRINLNSLSKWEKVNIWQVKEWITSSSVIMTSTYLWHNTNKFYNTNGNLFYHNFHHQHRFPSHLCAISNGASNNHPRSLTWPTAVLHTSTKPRASITSITEHSSHQLPLDPKPRINTTRTQHM